MVNTIEKTKKAPKAVEVKGTTKKAKTVNTVNTAKTVKKEVKTEKAPKVEVKEEVVKKERQVKAPKVEQMKNSELRNLMIENGCLVRGNAKDTSDVVYVGFGTQSRILQQKNAYQLLLTNGHKKVKEQVVECDNDDTARFLKWYEKLSKGDKAMVSGADTIKESKLSESELPREKQCKLLSKEILVKFIQYMSKFEENKVVTATENAK